VPTHSDPEDLALRALGETLDHDDEHLASCARCQSELDQLRAVVATARAVESQDHPQAPPASVWDGVVAELGLSSAAATDFPVGRGERSRHGRSTALTAAAAVLGIVVGAAGALLVSGGNEAEGPGIVVATADLAALPGHKGIGVARVRGSGAGRVLVLDVSGLSTGVGVYEVWLLDKDGKRLVSLGVLSGSEGRFPLPVAVDVREFPVVDVSIEPVDGDPAHSGDSVVRGVLAG
jgi:hypothetical protein